MTADAMFTLGHVQRDKLPPFLALRFNQNLAATIADSIGDKVLSDTFEAVLNEKQQRLSQAKMLVYFLSPAIRDTLICPDVSSSCDRNQI